MEPDYVTHLTRAEIKLKRVYELMCEGKQKDAILQSMDVRHELDSFEAWLVSHAKGK